MAKKPIKDAETIEYTTPEGAAPQKVFSTRMVSIISSVVIVAVLFGGGMWWYGIFSVNQESEVIDLVVDESSMADEDTEARLRMLESLRAQGPASRSETASRLEDIRESDADSSATRVRSAQLLETLR